MRSTTRGSRGYVIVPTTMPVVSAVPRSPSFDTSGGVDGRDGAAAERDESPDRPDDESPVPHDRREAEAAVQRMPQPMRREASLLRKAR